MTTLKVLIIDDNPEDREVYRRLLRKAPGQDFETVEADTGREGLESVHAERPDCILLDYRLPDIDGLEFLAELLADVRTVEVPVVMLTGQGSEAVSVEALKRGALDYAVKGDLTSEGLSRAILNSVDKMALRQNLSLKQRELERAKAELEATVVKLNEANRGLQEATALARHQATHDPLTGLANRQLFLEHLRTALEVSRRHGHRMAVLFLDLDGFKRINDTLGHASGDRLLVAVAERLASLVRVSDVACRIGGDEFTILLHEIPDPDAAGVVAQKVLDELSREFEVGGRPLSVACSVGIAVYPGDGESADALLAHADAAMYEAKRGGGSTFHFYVGESP